MKISDFQVGNEMRSVDLIELPGGKRRNPNFPGGQGRREETSESLMNSARSSYQQGVLMEEDHRSVLIIGGIQIFLPTSPSRGQCINCCRCNRRKTNAE
jgi:hypothetical protein